MQSSVKERLTKFLKYKGLSQKRFEVKAGLSNGYVNNIRRSITEDKLQQIALHFPELNTVWLLTGAGEMLNTPTIAEENNPSAMLPESSFKFAAGQTQLINGNEEINRYWYLPDCTDCDAVAPVSGTSMLPTLPPGCFVALKRIHISDNNPNTIPFGQIFGIVVEDEQTGEYHGMIKVLRRHKDPDMAAKYWIAHSLNSTEFDDFDIALSQVRSLWVVKQHIVSDYI